MKKMIFAVVLTAGILLQVNAQDATSSKFNYGVKAGVNFANVTGNGVRFFSGDDDEDVKSRIGLAVGGFVSYSFSDKFALQSGVEYSQQGYKDDYFIEDIILKLNYINIPITAKYFVMDGFSLELGPQIGFLTTAKAEVPSVELLKPNTKAKKSTEIDIDERFKSTDFGLNFGTGYQLENGLGINVKYYLGLMNILDIKFNDLPSKPDTKETFEFPDYELKNRVFNVSLFYTF